MKRFQNLLFASAIAWAGLASTGCAGSARMPESPSAPPSAAPAPALERSLFSRDLTGSVAEDDLQKILASQLDLAFPARVGVVTLGEAFRAEASAPVGQQAVLGPTMTRALEGSPHFSHVTDVSTGLANPHGVEGLRTIAARYRVRYLLLCNVVTEDTSHLNNWAWLYPTIVGFFVAPGVTVGSQGLLEASLMDVKSGTVLFTATEPFESSSAAWVIGSSRHHTKVDSKAVSEAASRLARSVLSQTNAVAAWADRETRLAQGKGTDSTEAF